MDSDILDQYVDDAPSGKAALDIFRGEWSSKLPAPYDLCTGQAELFEDARITWATQRLGGVEGFRVLELGPLEAGHTTMLERAGAEAVVAVEGNTRAYLKCLIVKELLGLRRATFLCGDFVEYLKADSSTYDLCVASGVLYHLPDPIGALSLMSKAADRLLLWTHYYDDEIISAVPHLKTKFSPGRVVSSGDFMHTEYRYEYRQALDWRGFCGGKHTYSNWLSRLDILAYLRGAGFRSIEIEFDHSEHPNGPAFALLAQK